MTRKINPRTTSLTLAAGALALAAGNASADQVILDDLIVDGSACIGQDCVNGESFGFDTIRIKENNLRIKAQDTSSTASFPTNDWQLTFNDSSNGGQNKFSVDDIDGGRTPFTLEAGAPSHSLYVDDGGRIGLGTSTPVVEVHVKDGDTPTVRLEQDGTSGFTPQTWDVAGNETNFFIRDVTNGSKLPFRSRPGAPTSSIDIAADGNVGVGTSSPQGGMHIRRNMATNLPHLVLDANENNTGGGTGRAELWFVDGSTYNVNNDALRMQLNGDDFNIVYNGSGGGLRIKSNSDVEVPNGNLIVDGTISSGGTNLNVPDYVFAPDYELMPLQEVGEFIVANRHLPKIPSAEEVQANGLNITDMQLALLEKVEELTLYTLQQQHMIDALQERLETLAD